MKNNSAIDNSQCENSVLVPSHYLSLDVETGGIGLDKSLLTLGCVVADEDFNILVEEEWSYIPDDGIYHVTAKGMEVNGINIVELAKRAISYKSGGTELYNFLYTHSHGGYKKLTVVGKNVHGDIDHICNKLMKRETWENFCSYRLFDATAAHMMLCAAGKIPKDVSGSLSSLCDYYGIEVENLHDALADARMTLKVLKKMVQEIS